MVDVFEQPQSLDLVVAHDADGLLMDLPPVKQGALEGTAGIRQVAFAYGDPQTMTPANAATAEGVMADGRKELTAPPRYAQDTARYNEK